ncbi:hypothetical protein I552_10250 [Mycobacterium xenopi 3993]|nr:hypothetical protein I552_10250 [Mycobacterium xenopi 3993]
MPAAAAGRVRPHLHQTLHGERLTAEQIEQRDSHVHRAYALHRSARP